ncbi:hypothetical protein J1N35_025228 [Gossypium stocksii]|uniref:Uncharacterized protein n=1 Tax=Gossypium stocksii TaxID=47602 RepID=A0A9D3ZW00_9ROSI|nr:hypothetical protein J1N35_025228 [Gossypium stocksii]
MTPKERVSQYPNLGIMIPLIDLNIGDHPSMVSRYPPSKKTFTFETDKGITISSYWILQYRYRERNKIGQKV